MQHSRIPTDDRMLEMEEVEGLLVSPPAKSHPVTAPISVCDKAYRGRWSVCIVTIIIVLCFLFISGSEELQFWEGDKGEKVDDVEQKAPTTISPQDTPMPTTTHNAQPKTATTTPATAVPVAKPLPVTAAPVQTPVPSTTPSKAEKISSATSGNAMGAAAFPKPDQIVRIQRPGAAEQQVELAKEWGTWEFTDTNADSRPKGDYCAPFNNRDIPRDKFPENAWQTDKEYLAKFLDEGIKLVNRSTEAILAEYGKGVKDLPGEDVMERSKMFRMSFFNLTNGDKPAGKELPENGGWTNTKSFEGLKRRLRHALMTNDSFNVILGGHSAAAGHGNSFKQSYIMQFHKVMEPVLALLHIRLTSRNLAQGGLGTLQSALGARSIYGDEIDIMIWDSGMTEGRDAGAVDLFERQALIGGSRVPMLLGGNFGNLKMLHEECDADIGQYGSGMLGIPTCEDETQVMTIPYAARYMKCTTERKDLCDTHKFDSICWPDDYTGPIVPDAKQDAKPGSQVSWHPGNLSHQITGRVIAMVVLFALQDVLTQWNETPDFLMPDELWHVSDYYDNIRRKVRELPFDVGDCMKSYNDTLPLRVCNTPLYGATEFTPRANPDRTSIQSLIKPAENGYIPHLASNVQYKGQGPYNPKLDPPVGAIDVLSIVSNGREYDGNPARNRRLEGDVLKPGVGWSMQVANAGYCDGTWNSECGRESGTTCLLSGHSDGRGGLIMDGYSGWLVLTLPAIREGIIILKIETWHSIQENPLTSTWKSENNERRALRHSRIFKNEVDPSVQVAVEDFERDERRLKAPPPDYCDDFRFEYAIDGKVTSLDKEAFKNFSKSVQRVVETQTILDDPNYTNGETRSVEIGIRMVGCHDTTKKAMKLTHLYWA